MGLLRADDWSARWIAADLKVDPARRRRVAVGGQWIWFPEPGAES